MRQRVLLALFLFLFSLAPLSIFLEIAAGVTVVAKSGEMFPCAFNETTGTRSILVVARINSVDARYMRSG
jgi:hypothetical protein